MELRQLRVFQAVARTGSAAAAAAQLHLTPSALSHALKALESEFGLKLFSRARRGLKLNAAGERFLAEIEPHLQGLNQASAALRGMIQGTGTQLRIGAAASICKYLLPQVIRELRHDYPRLDLRVDSADTLALIEKVKAAEVDLGLGIKPEGVPGFISHSVLRDELMFVFASSHRWAKGMQISEENLRDQIFILYRRQSLSAKLVERRLRELGVAQPRVMEIGSMEAIKEFVRLDLGVAVLPPWVAGREIRRGLLRIRPMARKPLRREWALFHRSSHSLAPVEARFLRLCRAHAAGLPHDRNDIPLA